MQRFADRCRIPAGEVVILAGVAGGLNPALRVGDLIVADRVTCDHAPPLTPPLQLPEARGSLFSSNQICGTPEAKQDLRAHCDADAVDLESAQFAVLAAERGWKWGILRGISDDASMSLPPECPSWTDSQGRIRPRGLLLSILKHPGLLWTLPKLGRHSRKAMEAVGHGIVELVSQKETAFVDCK